MTITNQKFESLKQLIETYLFDDIFQSDFVYFSDPAIREYMEEKIAESLIRTGDLFSGNFEKKITREIKEKFLNLIEACGKENLKAETLLIKAAENLKDLKNKGVYEISANTRKSLTEGESDELIDFISDSEDYRLEAGEDNEEEESETCLFDLKTEEINIKEKRAYCRRGQEREHSIPAFAF